MRLVRATMSDCYQVHRTLAESMEDQGQKVDHESLYSLWPKRLTDERFSYILLMHSRKVVGMIWGQELEAQPKKTLLIEGQFLRRAYRGRFRFSREMVQAVKSLAEGYESVLMLLPQGKVKLPRKYSAVGTLVQVGGNLNGK